MTNTIKQIWGQGHSKARILVITVCLIFSVGVTSTTSVAGIMLVSDTNPSLAVNAYGGAAHGTVLKLVNNCPPDNPDCNWTLRNLMITSDTKPSLVMNAYGGAAHGTVLKLVNNCPPDNSDCNWTFHKGLLLSDTNPSLAMNAYGGAAHGTVLKLVNNCPPNNSDCTWTLRKGMLLSDTNPGLAMNAYGGAAHGTVLKLVNNCPPSNPDCTWTYQVNSPPLPAPSLRGSLGVLALNVNGIGNTNGIDWETRATRIAAWTRGHQVVPDVFVLQEVTGWLSGSSLRSCGRG